MDANRCILAIPSEMPPPTKIAQANLVAVIFSSFSRRLHAQTVLWETDSDCHHSLHGLGMRTLTSFRE